VGNFASGGDLLGSLDSIHVAHAHIDLREQVRRIQAAEVPFLHHERLPDHRGDSVTTLEALRGVLPPRAHSPWVLSHQEGTPPSAFPHLSRGTSVPDSAPHGNAAERVRWAPVGGRRPYGRDGARPPRGLPAGGEDRGEGTEVGHPRRQVALPEAVVQVLRVVREGQRAIRRALEPCPLGPRCRKASCPHCHELDLVFS